jgi:hypothetical protein
MASCSESAVTASTNSCAATHYTQYNPKDLAQCTEVCRKCINGTPTTCSTSCTLRGALAK